MMPKLKKQHHRRIVKNGSITWRNGLNDLPKTIAKIRRWRASNEWLGRRSNVWHFPADSNVKDPEPAQREAKAERTRHPESNTEADEEGDDLAVNSEPLEKEEGGLKGMLRRAISLINGVDVFRTEPEEAEAVGETGWVRYFKSSSSSHLFDFVGA